MKIGYCKWVLCGITCFVVSHVTQAAIGNSNPESMEVVQAKKDGKDLPYNRFQPYGPSSVLLQQWTEDDQTALEVDYSFKYILYNCDYAYNYETHERDPSCDEDKWNGEFYFSFTGQFDFYVDLGGDDDDYGRDSGPVINRISNPALHYRIYPQEGQTPIKNLTLEWFDIGFEHRSNGQVVEIDKVDTDPASATTGQLLTQIAYDNDDHEYFDGLSRGANYISLSANFRRGMGRDDETDCNHTNQCAIYSISAKYYMTNDSDVNWGPNAKDDISIKDYDIVRLGYTNKFHTFSSKRPTMSLSAVYTFGQEFMKTDSLDVAISRPFETIKGLKWPWYVKMHFGPMGNLSNYSKSAKSIGVGFLFSL